MNYLTTPNLAGVTIAALGGLVIGNGIKDFKNDSKLLGIAKMTLGLSIAGACFAAYQYLGAGPLPIENCKMGADVQHASCPRVMGLVHDILGQGRLQNLGDENFFPKLTSKMYEPESLTCRGSEKLKILYCQVEHTVKHHSLIGELNLKNTFKTIPGCELFEKIQVYIKYSKVEIPQIKAPNQLLNVLLMQDVF